MEFKLNNGSGGLCCKSCGRQDKQLNTYDWLADIPGNADESELVEVQFKNTRKGYFRNSNKIPLEKGDIVSVEATPVRRLCSRRWPCCRLPDIPRLQSSC